MTLTLLHEPVSVAFLNMWHVFESIIKKNIANIWKNLQVAASLVSPIFVFLVSSIKMEIIRVFVSCYRIVFIWVLRKIGSHRWGCILNGWNCKYSKYKILVNQCTWRKRLWKNIPREKLSVWTGLCGNGKILGPSSMIKIWQETFVFKC